MFFVSSKVKSYIISYAFYFIASLRFDKTVLYIISDPKMVILNEQKYNSISSKLYVIPKDLVNAPQFSAKK